MIVHGLGDAERNEAAAEPATHEQEDQAQDDGKAAGHICHLSDLLLTTLVANAINRNRGPLCRRESWLKLDGNNWLHHNTRLHHTLMHHTRLHHTGLLHRHTHLGLHLLQVRVGLLLHLLHFHLLLGLLLGLLLSLFVAVTG